MYKWLAAFQLMHTLADVHIFISIFITPSFTPNEFGTPSEGVISAILGVPNIAFQLPESKF